MHATEKVQIATRMGIGLRVTFRLGYSTHKMLVVLKEQENLERKPRRSIRYRWHCNSHPSSCLHLPGALVVVERVFC